MSSDPRNQNDFETAEFESPEAEVASGTGEEDLLTQESPPPEEEQPKKGKKGKKPKKEKPKKEKKPRAESDGAGSPLRKLFPSVYSVMLAIALLAILIAIAVLAVELSRYDFDIKASTAMRSGPLSVAAAQTTLA